MLTHGGPVVAASFSPDGKTVVTATGKQVILWDAMTGERRGEPIEYPDDVWALKFCQAGDRLVTADRSGHARVWDAASGKLVGLPLPQVVPDADQSRFYKMGPALSPDGLQVLTAIDGKTAQAYEASTGKMLWKVPSRGIFLSYSTNGKYALVENSSVPQVVDAQTGNVVVQLRTARETGYMDVTPNGGLLVTGISGGGVCLWNMADGRLPASRSTDFLRRLRFSGDGRWLVTASQDGTARVWDSTGSFRRLAVQQ